MSEKITAALGKSHCFFADLLEKFPKADYKTVASTVARLYEDGKIRQDKDGKFELAQSAEIITWQCEIRLASCYENRD